MGQLREPRTAAELAEAMAIAAVDKRRAYDRPGEDPGSSQRLAEELVQSYIRYRGGIEGLNLSVVVDQARKLSRTWLAQEAGEFYWDGTADIGGDHLIAVREIQGRRPRASGGISAAMAAHRDRSRVTYPFTPSSPRAWDLEVADARMLRHERGDVSRERAIAAAEAIGGKVQALYDAGNKAFDFELIAAEAQREAGPFSESEIHTGLQLFARHWIHGADIRAAVGVPEPAPATEP